MNLVLMYVAFKAKNARTRRIHNFAEDVRKNERIANKSESIMASKTNCFTSCFTKCLKLSQLFYLSGIAVHQVNRKSSTLNVTSTNRK